MSQRELALKIDKSPQQFNANMKGRRGFSKGLIRQVAYTLGVSEDNLMRSGNTDRGIPVIAYISAGGGIIPESQDQYAVGEGIEYMELPPGYTQDRAHKEGIYGLKVRGDSMLPLLRSGSRLYIKPGNDIRNGDYVIFRDDSGVAYVKEIEMPDEDTVIFRSVGVGPTLIRKRSEITRLEKVWLIER